MEDIIIVDNNLKPEDFIRLRLEAGFMETPMEQAEKALANGLFTASALCGDKIVGMGRLIGDGAMYWYIQDVAVMPEYQGRGIGKAIVTRLISYAEANSLPGSKASIGLIAAKGKEPFYEKMGFIPLEVFPLLWDEANPCLFLAKHLACSQENRG